MGFNIWQKHLNLALETIKVIAANDVKIEE